MRGYRTWPLLAVLAGIGPAGGAVVSLTVPSPLVVVNSELVMDLVISYEPGEPGDLFSFGARVDVHGPGNVVSQSITVADDLDYLGPNGPGALIDLTPATLGVKGTIEILNPPMVPYGGAVLAQYRFQFPEVGQFTFTPREFNTLGPTEEIFVAGDGQVLDDSLTFVSVTVDVIPEPGPGALALAAGSFLLARRRRGGIQGLRTTQRKSGC